MKTLFQLSDAELRAAAHHEPNRFSDSEHEFLQYQLGYGQVSAFTQALHRAIALADPANRRKLAREFPLEVQAQKDYQDGTLAKRVLNFKDHGRPDPLPVAHDHPGSDASHPAEPEGIA